MPHIGPWELALILAIVLIVFGVGRLPQIGGAIGKGIREFRKGSRGDVSEEEKGAETSKSQMKSTDKAAEDSAKPGNDTKTG